MSSKVDRAVHGPGWGEVILGAVLSLILGVVIGAVLLVLKPVVVAKEMPKEPVPGTVYYIQGMVGGPSQAQEVLAKRKALVQGQSIKVTESEINALAAANAATGAKAAGKASSNGAKSDETVSTGVPNVRIHNGALQVAVPVTLNIFGFEQKVIAQARGGFEKNGDVFAYDPDEIYLGSCPVQRLPFLASYIRHKVTNGQNIPDDVVAAWSRLASVTIDGNVIDLSMQ